MNKDYLGDSVYVEVTPEGMLCLTTDNGMGASNEIFLEPEVYQALVNYVARIKAQCQQEVTSASESSGPDEGDDDPESIPS